MEVRFSRWFQSVKPIFTQGNLYFRQSLLKVISNDNWRIIHFLAFCRDYVFENGTYLSVVSESPYIGIERKLPIQEMKLFSPEEPPEKGEKGVGVKIFSQVTKSHFSSDKRNSSCTAGLLSLPSMSEPYFTLKIQLHRQVIKGKRLFCRCFCKWKYFEDLMRLLFSLTYSL